jgi:hypothetical protein
LVSPASLTFTQAPGTSGTQTVTLRNTGRGEVTITSATIESDTRGSFSVPPTSVVIPGSGEVTLEVTYAPAGEGDDAARLAIEADATNGSTFVVALLGTSHVVSADAGEPDGGAGDAGQPDGGEIDGGQPDGGAPDAGQTDGGTTDGGQPDGGAPDAGPPDAGPPVYTVTGFPGALGQRTSSGGTFTVEGEVGLPAPRVKSSGGTFTVEPLIP